MQLTIKAKQAARRAQLLRGTADRLKAEVKPLRKRYKQARKAGKKAERLAKELEAFVKTTAKRTNKPVRSSRLKRPSVRAST